MRILILPSWYPTPAKPVNGIFIREQADALSAVHEVRVLYLDILPRGTKAKSKRLLKQDRGYIEETIEVPNLTLIWQFIYLFRMARALRRLRRVFAPQVIHCHIAVPATWAAVMLRRIVGAPIVLTENSSEFGSWLKRPGLRWMAKKAFKDSNMVIAVSEGQRQRVEQAFGRKKSLVLVPNIVDTSKFVPTPLPNPMQGYRLLFIGLMDTDQKGVSFLLEAVARIKSEGLLDRPLLVDMVGDGILRSMYEKQAEKLALSDSFIFHGLQTHETIARMMRECHALVLSSLHEALPLVIIEAMASGRPVISTRCGGPEYMIGIETGLIVEPGQEQALAQAIVELLTHLENYDPQRIAAQAVERYSYEAVTSALTNIYANLQSAKGTD